MLKVPEEKIYFFFRVFFIFITFSINGEETTDKKEWMKNDGEIG